MFKVIKKNNELIFNDFGGFEHRNISSMWCINEADKLYNWKDFNEIEIFTNHYENNINQFTYSKQNSYNKLIPDFNFHMWPEVGINDYNETIKNIDMYG